MQKIDTKTEYLHLLSVAARIVILPVAPIKPYLLLSSHVQFSIVVCSIGGSARMPALPLRKYVANDTNTRAR